MTMEAIKDAITHLSDQDVNNWPIGSKSWMKRPGISRWRKTLPLADVALIF